MLDKLRELAVVRALRGKLVNIVDEAVGRHYAAHREELAALRRELAELRAELQQESNRLLEFDKQVEIRDRRDIFAEWEREALAESAEFVKQHMPQARPLDDPRATLEYALQLAPAGGMALEFGVYTGSTLQLIAAARDGRQVYGFDSFDGLPEDWRAGFPVGAFDTENRPNVPGAELVVGLFDDTLPRFLAEHEGQVDFVHVDSDLYASACTVLEHVGPRLRPGSVLLFDEFFNFPGWAEHENQAWSEYVARTGTSFRYEGCTLDNEQVVVRITAC